MKKILGMILMLLVIITTLLYFIRPPGNPPKEEHKHVETSRTKPLLLSQGRLPGVTWVDDIHPIFIKNKCKHCHTRGREAIVEGFKDFSLGIIDPNDENNAYYSYHELVYAQGPPQIQKGEILRDGQCCWPRNYPLKKQRRIWIGYPERSVLIRKLEYDYYDWDRPPRFFEEGLKLKWGVPMPMSHKSQTGEEHSNKYYDIRPFYKILLFNLTLWIGGNGDELYRLPEQIPASDRMLLRYWITNAIQIMEEGSGIEVQIINTEGVPLKNAVVKLVGDYNSPEKREVIDQIIMKTGTDGKVTLSFPVYSVITSIWYISSKKDGIRSEFKPLVVNSGMMNQMTLVLK